jgi:hypothetical protein
MNGSSGNWRPIDLYARHCDTGFFDIGKNQILVAANARSRFVRANQGEPGLTVIKTDRILESCP